MRAGTRLYFAGLLVLAVSSAVGGCGKLKRNDPVRAERGRAELKRQQTACGSESAGDRLKNLMFDQAIAQRQGNRANLDLLADYSVARLQDPVVKGWDRSLDITRCEARFILEVPPGAERGFGGARRLQADLHYTAQASADGAGFVYQQKGAEQIVANLASFNIASGVYRPPPAIDEPHWTTVAAEQPASAPLDVPREAAQSRPAARTVPLPLKQTQVAAKPPEAPRPKQVERVAERTPAEPKGSAPAPERSPNGESTIRSFYGALRAGNGAAASSEVIPEKRSSGPYSPNAISRFYGRLPEPIRLTSVVPLSGGAFRVTYHYSAGRSQCNGSAVVRLANRGKRNLIHSIHALSGC